MTDSAWNEALLVSEALCFKDIKKEESAFTRFRSDR